MSAAIVTARRQAPRAGAEFNEHGFLDAIDPRTMSEKDLLELGHKRMAPTAAIRLHCLDCAGSAHEVGKCMALRCPSWPWRMGTNPWRASRSEAQIEAARRNVLKMHSQHGGTRSLGARDTGTPSEVPEYPETASAQKTPSNCHRGAARNDGRHAMSADVAAASPAAGFTERGVTSTTPH
jgi:hypothetical protein